MRSADLVVLFAIFTPVTTAACGSNDPSETGETGRIESALTETLENNQPFSNPSGRAATFSTAGFVDLTGPFFQDLGSNGRRCVTCHQQDSGWTITPPHIQELFEATAGTDPLFVFDGRNCAGADTSTLEARRSASSLMLDKGLVRFIRPIPANAEFELVAFEGTYCNEVNASQIVVFRRPLPTTNFASLNAVLWDTLATIPGQTIDFDLNIVANGAAQLHSERPDPLSDAQRQGMVSFMQSLFTAQIFDDAAHDLTARDALGGPENLASMSPQGAPGFSLYDTWRVSTGADPSTEAERRAVEHGEEIFDTRPIRITGVTGLGGDVVGTCSTCHSVPNFGNRAVFGTLNIGIADAAHRTADLPLYTFRNKTTGEVVQSSDPGRALVTGSWADMNTFKVPGLRGLAARAPYFHNGMAATLEDVVEFYDARFEMGLDGQDEEDLIHFLETL